MNPLVQAELEQLRRGGDELARLINAIDPGPTPIMKAVAAGEEWAVAYWEKMKIEMAEDIRRAIEESEDDENE